MKAPASVIPAKAGIHDLNFLDPRLRGDDNEDGDDKGSRNDIRGPSLR